MRRTVTIVLVALVAALMFGGLVHTVLMAAHVSEPAATAVRGFTLRRLWAGGATALALIGITIGEMAMYRAQPRVGNHGRRGPFVAIFAGFVAAVNSGVNLAVASGGPGIGNGVVGGAAAFVLGPTALVLGGEALARSRRFALQKERTT